jgi:hypothetical protein
MDNSKRIAELREAADRYERAVSSTAGPSSQEWVSPERQDHYYKMAAEKRAEADRLEKKSR